MKSDGPQILDLVGLLYEAVDDLSGWKAVLDGMAEILRASSVGLLAQDLRHDQGNITVSCGQDPVFQRSYDEYYGARNEWLVRGKHLLEEGAVIPGERTCPSRELVKTEFYNDWLRPQGMFHTLGAIITRQSDLISFCGMLRTSRRPAFGEQEVRLMHSLVPHLRRAIRLHRQFLQVQDSSAVLKDAMHRVPLGYALVDGEGEVQFANQAAQRIFDARDGLSLRDGRIEGIRSNDTAKLRLLIRQGARGGLDDDQVMGVERGSQGRLSIRVCVSTAAEQRRTHTRRVVSLFLSDSHTAESAVSMVAKVFGLTNAESKLVSLLAEGATLGHAAELSSISRETARNQLKSVFHKTGTHRQADLVRLTLTSVARLRPSKPITWSR